MPVPSVLFRLRRFVVWAMHIVLVPIGYYAAFALRFDGTIPPEYQRYFWSTVGYLVVIRLAAFGVFGLFHGWWRHVGMSDLVALIKAVTASSVLLVVVLYMTSELAGYPRSVVVLDWAVAMLIFGGGRFAVRAFREERLVPWRSRRCCSAFRRFWTYLSSRISPSDRPRSCSRTTYRATCSSAEPRENRNENMFLNPDTRRDCIPGNA